MVLTNDDIQAIGRSLQHYRSWIENELHMSKDSEEHIISDYKESLVKELSKIIIIHNKFRNEL